MKIGGKKEHIALVKLASIRLINDLSDRLEGFNLSFEDKHFGIDFKLELGESWSHADGHFNLIPDIVAQINPRTELLIKGRKWHSIIDSRTLIFEAETDPRNIFHNAMKMMAYAHVKRDYGRGRYAFILVCREDAKLPDNIDPFDEVWKFSEAELKKAELKRKFPK